MYDIDNHPPFSFKNVDDDVLRQSHNPMSKHREHISHLLQTDLFVLAQESKAVIEGVPGMPYISPQKGTADAHQQQRKSQVYFDKRASNLI